MTAPDRSPLVELRGAGRLFGGGLLSRAPAVTALAACDLVLAPAETLAVVGESGSGKSTLGRLVLRLDRPTSGRVLWRGRDVTDLPERRLRPLRPFLAQVAQDPYASLNPHLTVGETITEPLVNFGLANGAALRARLSSLLAAVGLPEEAAARRPHAFSGGQRQRIAIARALAAGPRAIVCDEAVSALDISVRAQIVNLLVRLQRAEGLAYLFIAHDVDLVRHIAHRVMVLYRGRTVEEGPARAVLDAPAHPYTRELVGAVPASHPSTRRGLPPTAPAAGPTLDPARPAAPAGCAFRARCPVAADRCRSEVPALRPLPDGRRAACHFPQSGGSRAQNALSVSSSESGV